MHEAVTLRYAFPDDATAVARLAALDSAETPAGPLLLAEVAGQLRAALSLSDGRAIADPFERTAAVVMLLRQRAAQLSPSPPVGWRRISTSMRARRRDLRTAGSRRPTA